MGHQQRNNTFGRGRQPMRGNNDGYKRREEREELIRQVNTRPTYQRNGVSFYNQYPPRQFDQRDRPRPNYQGQGQPQRNYQGQRQNSFQSGRNYDGRGGGRNQRGGYNAYPNTQMDRRGVRQDLFIKSNQRYPPQINQSIRVQQDEKNDALCYRCEGSHPISQCPLRRGQQ